jgi:hypothetical protein
MNLENNFNENLTKKLGKFGNYQFRFSPLYNSTKSIKRCHILFDMWVSLIKLIEEEKISDIEDKYEFTVFGYSILNFALVFASELKFLISVNQDLLRKSEIFCDDFFNICQYVEPIKYAEITFLCAQIKLIQSDEDEFDFLIKDFSQDYGESFFYWKFLSNTFFCINEFEKAYNLLKDNINKFNYHEKLNCLKFLKIIEQNIT